MKRVRVVHPARLLRTADAIPKDSRREDWTHPARWLERANLLARLCDRIHTVYRVERLSSVDRGTKRRGSSPWGVEHGLQERKPREPGSIGSDP
jgi:hypothetical protein